MSLPIKIGAVLGSFLLAVTIGLAAPVAAVAEPVGGQSVGPPAPNYKHRATVSAKRYAALKMGRRLKLTTPGRTMDYREARQIFGSHYIYRRQFAAGWKVAGGRISHVSAAELRKIEAERRRGQPRIVSLLLTPQDTNCTGTTKYVRHVITADYPNEYWYNSCATNKISRNLGWCMGAAGVVALLVGNPGVGAMMGMLIAACGGSSGWVSTAQSNSRVSAVIVYTGRVTKYYPEIPGPNTTVRYQAPVKVVPQ